MSDSVRQLLDENGIHCVDRGSLDSLVHFPLASLDALDDTESRHFWSASKRRLVRRLLCAYVRQEAFAVLDVGCGNGGLLRYLEQAFPEASVAGMDGYPEALLRCRRRSKQARLYLQDIAKLSRAKTDSTFDVITLMDVLEHLDHPVDVLRSVQRFLTPQGIVVATVPASRSLWSDRDVFLGHKARHSRSTFTALFTQSGYDVLRSNYAFSYLFAPAYVYRRCVAPLRRMDGASVEASELRVVPGINAVLKVLGILEAAVTTRVPIPFGTSVYAVARPAP